MPSIHYEWTIVENDTGAEIGRLRSHLSQAAFVVDDSKILFEVGPYSRRVDGNMVEQRLSVHVVDVASACGPVRCATRPTVDRFLRETFAADRDHADASGGSGERASKGGSYGWPSRSRRSSSR